MSGLFHTCSNVKTIVGAPGNGGSNGHQTCNITTIYDETFSATRVAYLAVELQKEMTPACYATVTASEQRRIHVLPQKTCQAACMLCTC